MMLETSRGFVVRDLNSANGTFINREKLGEQERVLNHGDRMRLGSGEVTMIFRQKGPETLSMDAQPPIDDGLDADNLPGDGEKRSSSLIGKESVLLSLLESRKLSAVSVDEICRYVWPELSLDSVIADGTLDRAFKGLRDHLKDDPKDPDHIITACEYGYLLV